MNTYSDLQVLAKEEAEERALSPLRGNSGAMSGTTNPAGAYLASLGSEVSRRVMQSPLNAAARMIHPGLAGGDAWRAVRWELLTAPVVRVLFSRTMGSPATRNKMLSALKGVARMAWELRLLNTDELERIRAIKGDSGTREPSGRCIPGAEVSALLQACACDASPAGVRDTAMFSLAAVSGARRAEIASLCLAGMEPGEDDSYTLKVIGKGNRERTLFVVGNAMRALEDWLAVRGDEPGALFCRVWKGGRMQPSEFVSPEALDKVLRKRSGEAKLAKLQWHDFRRTTASGFLDAGADIATVAKILGHANIQTTARYDRRGERAKRKAAGLLTVPYFGRDSV
jgi:site-specific recombinase XerD